MPIAKRQAQAAVQRAAQGFEASYAQQQQRPRAASEEDNIIVVTVTAKAS